MGETNNSDEDVDENADKIYPTLTVEKILQVPINNGNKNSA